MLHTGHRCDAALRRYACLIHCARIAGGTEERRRAVEKQASRRVGEPSSDYTRTHSTETYLCSGKSLCARHRVRFYSCPLKRPYVNLGIVIFSSRSRIRFSFLLIRNATNRRNIDAISSLVQFQSTIHLLPYDSFAVFGKSWSENISNDTFRTERSIERCYWIWLLPRFGIAKVDRRSNAVVSNFIVRIGGGSGPGTFRKYISER